MAAKRHVQFTTKEISHRMAQPTSWTTWNSHGFKQTEVDQGFSSRICQPHRKKPDGPEGRLREMAVSRYSRYDVSKRQ